MSSQTILQFLKANPSRKYHPMTIARKFNATVADILPVLMTLRRQKAIRSVGPSCCANMRYWGV